MGSGTDRIRNLAWNNRIGQGETGFPVFRPVVLLAGVWSAGKILISWPLGRWLAIPMVLLVFFTAGWFLGHEHPWLMLAVPLALAASMIQGAMILIPAERQAADLDGRYFRVQGTVSDVKVYPGGGCQARLHQNNGIVIQVSSPTSFDAGSRIEIGLLGSRPSGQRNPGGFDEARWLATQGIFLKGKVIDKTSIQVLQAPPALSLVRWGRAVRDDCYRLACRLLDPEQAALLNGLLLGDTSQLSPSRKLDFQQAGLSHLMSVSGANVAYILLPLSALLKRSRFSRPLRLAAVLPVLIAFGFMTGWQVSVSRAILMTAVTIMGRLIDRRVDTANALGLAVLVLQLIWPLSALSIGFWLSATASAALIYGADTVGRKLSDSSLISLPFRVPHGIASALAATICAQTAVTPLIVHTGGTLSLAGVLANLPAGPLAGATTLLASAIIPAALILDRLSGNWTDWVLPWLGRSLSFALDLLASLAALAARLPIGRVFTSQINLAFQGLLIVVVLLVFRPASILGIIGRSRLRLFLRPNHVVVLMLVLVLAGLGWNRLISLRRPPVEVWFFDVGQGDAILIREKSGKTILIDGGKPGSGYQVLLPALDELAIDRINLAVVTHGHDDHAGGLIELAERGRISQLLIPEGEAGAAVLPAGESPLTAGVSVMPAGVSVMPPDEGPPPFRGESNILTDLLSVCQDEGIAVQTGSAHDTIWLGQAVSLRILHPQPTARKEPGEALQPASTDANAQSLQILAELCDRRFLFTSDCTAEVERQLLEQGIWPRVDLLKVAHHGSRKTTGTAFLDQVRPQHAVISVGTNFYGHPAPDTLIRLQAANCSIWRTDQYGAVVCRITPETVTLSTWLDPAA